jgi:peptidoglycan/LPS O-acetylase OafA/YrhL
MIRVEDPLNDKKFRIFLWMVTISSMVGCVIDGVHPYDGSDILVSILCALIAIGVAAMLIGWYRKNLRENAGKQ